MQTLTHLLPLLLLVAPARSGPYLNVTEPSGRPAWVAGHGRYDQYDYWLEKSNTVQEIHIGDTLTIDLYDTNVSIINGDHGAAYWIVERGISHDCWGDGGLVMPTNESFNALYEVNYAKWLATGDTYCYPEWWGRGCRGENPCTPTETGCGSSHYPLHRVEPVSEPSSVLVLAVIIVATIVTVKKR